MASFLDDMQRSIYAGFKGKLRRGVVRHLVAANLVDTDGALLSDVDGARIVSDAGVDNYGRPVDRAPAYSLIEGFQDDYSAFTRANAGIPDNAVRVNIFAASIKPSLTPSKDMTVRFDYPAANGRPSYVQWFKLLGADTDPATALWVCPAFKVSPPDGE